MSDVRLLLKGGKWVRVSAPMAARDERKPVTVLYADLDYNAMQWAMNALAERRGATVARFDIPEPATRENVLAAYERKTSGAEKTEN